MPPSKPQVIHAPRQEGRPRPALALLPLAAPGALHLLSPAGKAMAAEWFERYLEDIFRYVLQRVPGVEEARDLTAEVFAESVVAVSPPPSECGCHRNGCS